MGGLRSHLQPAIGAFFYIGIIPLRVSAIMPIIGGCLWRWRLHRCLRWLLLNIHWWCLRYSHYRGVPVIWRVIRHSESIAAITIAITAIITRTVSISTEAKTGIETSYANETYSPMMMVPTPAMMTPTVVTSTTVMTSPITSAPASISRPR